MREPDIPDFPRFAWYQPFDAGSSHRKLQVNRRPAAPARKVKAVRGNQFGGRGRGNRNSTSTTAPPVVVRAEPGDPEAAGAAHWASLSTAPMAGQPNAGSPASAPRHAWPADACARAFLP